MDPTTLKGVVTQKNVKYNGVNVTYNVRLHGVENSNKTFDQGLKKNKSLNS